MCKIGVNAEEMIYYLFLLCYIFYVVLAVNMRIKGENKVLKVKNEGVVYKVLSCIFAVIFVVFVLIYRNFIDIVYLGIVSMFILKYFIEIRRN